MGRGQKHFISGGRKSMLALEGSQAFLARPPDKDKIKMAVLRW
jgi:hypothetical protein